ncbi:MAG: ABC transporter substrate-binding protein [Bacilli bacterium]|nr:ABC transporter substrate-binding protein [Bacilli bacterium]
MKKNVLFALTAILLTSCGGGNSPSSTSQISEATSEATSSPTVTKIKDMNGREVEVTPGSYRKIVCIGAGALRLYSYVGDNSLLAGVEDIDNLAVTGRPAMFDGVARPYFIANSEAYRGLASCGKGGPKAQAAEGEKILACAPDLVISEYEDVEKANALQEQVGVPVLTLKYGYGGVFDSSLEGSLTMLGKVLGKEKKAEKLIGYIKESKADIEKRTKDLTPSEKVYICGLGNWGTTNHLMTAREYMPFDIANIDNIGDELLTGKGIAAVELEKLVSRFSDIDKIVLDAAAIKNIKPFLEENPKLFEGCKAVENGEVYLEMAYNAYYTNLELALSNTYFAAKSVYPEAFGDIEIKSKLDEVTEAFLGKKLADDIYTYPQSYGGYQKISDLVSFVNEKVA